MTKSDAEWLVKFALRLTDEGLDLHNGLMGFADDVMELSRLATGLHKLAEVACERELSERETKRDARLTQRAREIVASFGSGFEAVEGSGDPRGAPLYVKVPSGYSDSWAGLGIVVPY